MDWPRFPCRRSWFPADDSYYISIELKALLRLSELAARQDFVTNYNLNIKVVGDYFSDHNHRSTIVIRGKNATGVQP